MSTEKICQECRQGLKNSSAECVCGWRSTAEALRMNSQCCYAGVCDRPGTVSLKLRGNTWYCSQHAEVMRRAAEQRYQTSEENFA